MKNYFEIYLTLSHALSIQNHLMYWSMGATGFVYFLDWANIANCTSENGEQAIIIDTVVISGLSRHHVNNANRHSSFVIRTNWIESNDVTRTTKKVNCHVNWMRSISLEVESLLWLRLICLCVMYRCWTEVDEIVFIQVWMLFDLFFSKHK